MVTPSDAAKESKRHAEEAELPLDQSPPHCANLHRPDGNGKLFADGVLYPTPLAASSTCDSLPIHIARDASAPMTGVVFLRVGWQTVIVSTPGVRNP